MQIDAQNYRFCVAPMMDWTDRYDRFFLRLMSRHARLYTEMVTADAILHGDKKRLLDFNVAEHPLALQLGGSHPHKLAQAAHIGADWGYDEINFNVGCPSDRVQNGRFGACLMSEPDLVADCLAAMRHAVDIPVTMKCRIGVDEQTPQDALFTLVEKTAAIGIEQISVHARKAWLQGLSPKQNRDIPPLDYPLVYRLKKQFPNLIIVLNGGLATLADALAQLPKVDGVMLGRAAYKTPYIMAQIDHLFFGCEQDIITRHQVVEQLIPYAEKMIANGTPLHALTRHLMGLYSGCAGGRQWRRFLSENAPPRGDDPRVLVEALALMRGFDAASHDGRDTRNAKQLA